MKALRWLGDHVMRLAGWLREQVVGSPEPPSRRYLTSLGALAWGALLLALGVALLSAVVNLWPVVDVSPPPAGDVATAAAPSAQEIATGDRQSVEFLWGAFGLSLTKSSGLMVLAALFGAIGGWVHATRVFVVRVGRRTAESTWMWWYAFNVLSGAALAVIAYMVIRGGLFGSESATAEVNPYGTAALAGLVGLFSRDAIDWLSGVFSKRAGGAGGKAGAQAQRTGPDHAGD